MDNVHCRGYAQYIPCVAYLVAMAGSMIAASLAVSLTSEKLNELDTWTKILEWSKAKLELWEKVATSIGEKELDDIMTIAMIENEDYCAAAKEHNLNGVQRARVSVAVNVARKKLGMGVSDVFAVKEVAQSPRNEGGSQGSTLAVTGTDQVDNGIVRDVLKVSQLFDQGCKTKEVRPLEEELITEMRDRWVKANGSDPIADLQFTDNQLSVVYRLNGTGHNMLGFDMGVYGPYGGRRERAFSMTACIKNAEGVYVSKEIPGAQNFEEWEAAWDFATVGFVMGGFIDRGVADAYKAFFKKLAMNYPSVWWMAYQADWQLRHEWALDERRRQKAFHQENPALSCYDVLRPWNSVLKAAVRGVESMALWEDSFKEKARKYERNRGATGHQWVARQAANFVAGQEGQGMQGVQPPPQVPAGFGKRALKRAAAAARGGTPAQQPPQQPPQRQRTEEAQRPTWADTKRHDGRFLYDYNGIELCFAWGRGHDGCTEVCTATPTPRAHGCEWCRGAHRSIRCPKHPNWVPETGKGGKAKGKGKGGKTWT